MPRERVDLARARVVELVPLSDGQHDPIAPNAKWNRVVDAEAQLQRNQADGGLDRRGS